MKIVPVAALLLACAGHSAAMAQKPDQLTVSRTDQSYLLTVPVSRLQMTLPAANLAQKSVDIGGSTSNPRYFHFSDSARGLILSGWFEPAARFKGIKAFWEEEQATWKNRGLPAPANVSLEKLGGWDAVFYEHSLQSLLSSHVRAHWVQAETWIDVHISVTTTDTAAANRSALQSVLGGIAVNEKREGTK